jgi:hypothetical protein
MYRRMNDLLSTLEKAKRKHIRCKKREEGKKKGYNLWAIHQNLQIEFKLR